jgi:hypothetical protein
MSKSEGKYIAVKFTESLVGAEATEHLRTGEPYLPVGTVTSSGDVYSSTRAFDGSTSSYWRPSTYPCWVQIELAEAVALTGFRWNTQTTSYRPKDFTVQGSNNGTDWTTIYTGQSPAESYWKEFIWDITNEAYKFYRWDISTKWSSYIYLYGIELIPVESYITNGNEIAFEVKGNVPDYVEYPSETLGPLTEKIFIVDNVIPHPTEAKTLLLTMKDMSEFKNIEGSLTVSYNASLGNLAGLGGAVQSFTEVFAPTDLVRVPNPLLAEKINASITDLSAGLTRIYYKDGYDTEIISASITGLTVNLINIADLNP